jgi:hypothetical protein
MKTAFGTTITIYQLMNIDTLEVFEGTANEFIRKYKFKESEVKTFLKCQNRLQYNGWICLDKD